MNNKQRLLVMCLELALECDKRSTCQDCPLWNKNWGCHAQELTVDNILEELKESCDVNE